MDAATTLITTIFSQCLTDVDIFGDSFCRVAELLLASESKAAFLANRGMQLIIGHLESAPHNVSVAKAGLTLLAMAADDMEVDVFPTLDLQTRCLSATVTAMETTMQVPVNAEELDVSLAGLSILHNLRAYHAHEEALYTNRHAPKVFLSMLKTFPVLTDDADPGVAEDFRILVALLTWTLEHDGCAPIDPDVIPAITTLLEAGAPHLPLSTLEQCLECILFDLVRRVEDSAPAPAKMRQFIDAGGVAIILRTMHMHLHCFRESFVPPLWTTEVLQSDVGRTALLAHGGMEVILDVIRRSLEAQDAKMVLMATRPLSYRHAPPHDDFLVAFVQAGGPLLMNAVAHAYPNTEQITRRVELMVQACAEAQMRM
jgi:hypothetical protein